jgi:uncharacterized membrane protein (UPF0136 family)
MALALLMLGQVSGLIMYSFNNLTASLLSDLYLSFSHRVFGISNFLKKKRKQFI